MVKVSMGRLLKEYRAARRDIYYLMRHPMNYCDVCKLKDTPFCGGRDGHCDPQWRGAK